MACVRTKCGDEDVIRTPQPSQVPPAPTSGRSSNSIGLCSLDNHRSGYARKGIWSDTYVEFGNEDRIPPPSAPVGIGIYESPEYPREKFWSHLWNSVMENVEKIPPQNERNPPPFIRDEKFEIGRGYVRKGLWNDVWKKVKDAPSDVAKEIAKAKKMAEEAAMELAIEALDAKKTAEEAAMELAVEAYKAKEKAVEAAKKLQTAHGFVYLPKIDELKSEEKKDILYSDWEEFVGKAKEKARKEGHHRDYVRKEWLPDLPIDMEQFPYTPPRRIGGPDLPIKNLPAGLRPEDWD